MNGETPAHLLDPDVTPNDLHFVRNNGLVPEMAEKGDAQGWKLVIDGEVNTPLELTLDQLKSRSQPVRHRLQLECGGNGRAGFNPRPAAINGRSGPSATPSGPAFASPIFCRPPT